VVDSIARHASGKADYAWARVVVQQRVEGATT
jgi:hypothetical protein